MNPPDPTSKKSCPVARQVLILTVIFALVPACKPALIVVFLTSVNPDLSPVAIPSKLGSNVVPDPKGKFVNVIYSGVPTPSVPSGKYPVIKCILPS